MTSSFSFNSRQRIFLHSLHYFVILFFLFDNGHMTLFYKNKLSSFDIIPGFYLIKVEATGQAGVNRIKRNSISSGFLLPVKYGKHFLAQCIVNGQVNFLINRQSILDKGFPIKRIGVS